MVSDTQPSASRSAPAARTVVFRIKRQDRPGEAPRWDEAAKASMRDYNLLDLSI